MNARHIHLSFALLSSGLLLAALLLVLSPHSPTARAELPAPPDIGFTPSRSLGQSSIR